MTLALDTGWKQSPVENEHERTPVTKEQKSHLYVTWMGYYVTLECLAGKIRDSGWTFDHILCIARGGMYAGDPLSRIFHKSLAVICTSSYRDNNGTQQNELIVSKHIATTTDTLGPHVLLVDDLVDTGDTMDAVKRRLQEDENIKEIRTAVLWRKSGSKFNPDYYVDEIDKHTWIHQPFEIYE